MVKRGENDKGKGKLNESTEGKSRRPKHEWSKEDVELLIQLLVEEAKIQLGRGGSLVGFQHRWANITEKFNDRRTGQDYVDRHQCKNKGDTPKGGWRKWKELANKQTDRGWNDAGNCCTYPEDWIARKAQENRGIHKLVNSKWPAYLVDQMELIWGQSYANGELRLTPGGVTPQHTSISENGEDNTSKGRGHVQGSVNMTASSNYEWCGGGCGGASMDISGGMQFGNSYGVVSSHNKRVVAPYNGSGEDRSAPIFDLATAASIGASLTANAFQGSPFAGIVAGSSNPYTPQLSLSVQPTQTDDTTGGIPNPYYSDFDQQYKPAHWDELMETTADGVVHGAKKKNLLAKKDPNMGKKKTKGSKGKSVVGANDTDDLGEGALAETLDNCKMMIIGLQAEAEKEDSIISVQEAVSVVRGI